MLFGQATEAFYLPKKAATKIQIVEDDEGKKRDNKTNRQNDNETTTTNDYVIK